MALGAGVHDITCGEYHCDPCQEISLTASGAKRILDEMKGCPALFKWYHDNPEPPKDVWDFGSVAHRLLLGKGDEFEVSPFPDYKTQKAREWRDEVRARGVIPIQPGLLSTAQEMVEALKQTKHGLWFNAGVAEETWIAQCPETGVWLRARPDWNIKQAQLIPDYKTARCAHPDSFSKAAWDYGYVIQAALYSEVAQLLGIMEKPAFVFVVQEKEPPYIAGSFQLDADSLEWGKILVGKAKRVLAECLEKGEWPDYTKGKLTQASIPQYARYALDMAEQAGAFDER